MQNTVSTKNNRISDFGQKIGGAKKDLWKERGLDISDLFSMNDAEKEKYVLKKNVWQKPDYEKMVEDGMPVELAYAIKMVYDAVPVRPQRSNSTCNEDYIEFVRCLRRAVSTVDSFEKLNAAGKSFLYGDSEYPARVTKGSCYVQPTDKAYGLVNNKLLRALTVSSYTLAKYGRDIRKKQFCVPKEEKLPAGFSVVKSHDGIWFVSKGHCILADGFLSREEAVEKAKEIGTKAASNRKKAFVPPQLESVERNGLPDVRNGKNVDGDDYISAFHIRGGEFGNWLSEKDAQTSLNMAYEAFCDFADVLGIEPPRVSFGNRLSIAFGARGNGNAVAHYEPMREVINITKMRGAGSLGHELFHALDDICGKKLGLGGFMTKSLSRAVPESVRNLMKVMTEKQLSAEESRNIHLKEMERKESRLIRSVSYYFTDKEFGKTLAQTVISQLSDKELCTENSKLSLCETLAEMVSDSRKNHTGRCIPKEERNQLKWEFYSYATTFLNGSVPAVGLTDFYKNSKEMDRISSREKNGYWSSEVEMFARAGACYLTDMLREKGGRSDYLSGHSESCVGMTTDNGGEIKFIPAMPQGEERKRINRAFREMIEELKAKKIL